MDFGDQRFASSAWWSTSRRRLALGFDAVSVNDHVVFGVPWLDGLMPSRRWCPVPATRGVHHGGESGCSRPAALAKVLAGLDVLSGGRVTAGLGPGSSARDYATVGVPFEERWPRYDEALVAMRALLSGGSFTGRFYAVDGPLEPPCSAERPPLWVGSWGSDVGLRRTVRLGDGWLASAYNITPEQFGQRWRRMHRLLDELGRDPAEFGNGLATMWFHIDDRRADDVLDSAAGPILQRPPEQLRERLAFGSAEAVTEKLMARSAITAYSECSFGRSPTRSSSSNGSARRP